MNRRTRSASAAPILGLLLGGCGLEEIPRRRAPALSQPVSDAAPALPADAGAPAPGVTIAGRLVPRGKAIVFLHIGHSNMAGRATGPDELRPFFYDPHPQLWSYADGRFRPAREPLSPDNSTGDKAGPGMALLRIAQSQAPADTFFISIGHGHSGSFGGYCASFRKGGVLYDIVMKPARELAGNVTFGAIFTMLGQSEYRFSPAQQRTLAECLRGVASEMRGDLADPELPFLVGDYEAGISRSDIHPTSPAGMTITAQLRMVPEGLARAAVIPTDGLPMEDTHHYDMAGHKGWAERAIGILRARGWARW